MRPGSPFSHGPRHEPVGEVDQAVDPKGTWQYNGKAMPSLTEPFRAGLFKMIKTTVPLRS